MHKAIFQVPLRISVSSCRRSSIVCVPAAPGDLAVGPAPLACGGNHGHSHTRGALLHDRCRVGQSGVDHALVGPVMVRILFSSTDAFGCPIRIKSACHSPKTLPARLHRRRETQGGAVEPCLRQRRSAEPDGHVAT